MVNKILGYALIVGGLLIIGFALFQSYNIFTDKALPPTVFKPESIENAPKKTNKLDLQGQVEELIKQQLGQMLPADTLTKLLNLFSWSILAGILIFGGGQIAGIGGRIIK
jgi:hypothetical protein